MLMDILNIDKKMLLKYIEKWSTDFGLEINGNYLLIQKDTVLDSIDSFKENGTKFHSLVIASVANPKALEFFDNN